MTDELYPIDEASKLCGLSTSVLRMWELRYGWPRPQRLMNGYRMYSKFEIGQLIDVRNAVAEGHPASTLIVDGMVKLPPRRSEVTIQEELAIARRRIGLLTHCLMMTTNQYFSTEGAMLRQLALNPKKLEQGEALVKKETNCVPA